MPDYLSQNAFAKLAGVSKQAISLAVKEGRVWRTARGIDPGHPTNKHYVQLLNLNRSGTTSNIENVEVLDTPADDHDPGSEVHDNAPAPVPRLPSRQRSSQYRPPPQAPHDLIATGKELDNKIKALKLSREKIYYFEQIRKSVPTSIVLRAFAQIGASVQTQFMMFDERAGQALFALVKSGASQEEFSAELREEIGDAMRAVIEVTEKTIESLRTVQPGMED
jgi:hypothetical protein